MNNKNIDVFAELKKNPKYEMLSEGAMVRLKFSIEVYQKREKLKLSQQELAKDIYTTQNIISRIEDADYNCGLELLNRLVKRLNINLKKVFSK